MLQNRTHHLRRLLLLSALLISLSGLASCGSQKIAFIYPDEALDFQMHNLKVPQVYMDSVTDMRSPEQRQGQGHFFTITYPGDHAWEVPATQIYAEALAQDIEQTNLFELVPLQAQADYVLSLDLLSMSCELNRSPAAFMLTGVIGASVGMVLGKNGSDRAKLAAVLAMVGLAAIPVPTIDKAEAEVRLTLRDRSGDILWQESCLGEYEARKYLEPTARKDQQLVNEHLTKAVKRANACLLGQLRNYLMEKAAAGQQQ